MDYYEILGVRQNATQREIEDAYQAQINYFTSRFFPGDKDVAQRKADQLREAYFTLSDPQRRGYYDYLNKIDFGQGGSTKVGKEISPEKKTTPKKGKMVLKTCFVLILIAFLYPALHATIFNEEDSTAETTSSTVNPDSITDHPVSPAKYFTPTSDSFTNSYHLGKGEIPTPISAPISGRMLDFDLSLEYIAPLTIETRGDKNYYIKLKDISTGAVVLSTYISGGDTADFEVPLGEYELVYATGNNWYGIDLLFWEETQYFKANETFDFYDDGEYINGWTVELYLQNNGNLTTTEISADDF